jgi:hypothetical protein
LELRLLRFHIAHGGVDLRLGQVALRGQLSGIELHDWVTRLQAIAFPRKNLRDATAHAWRDVDFVDLNRAGNTFGATLTSGGKESDTSEQNKRPGLQGAQKLINLSAKRQRFRSDVWIFRNTAHPQARDSA